MGTIIAKCTDNLLKACEKDAQKINLDEMVGFHTDALALLGHTQYELSLKRREAIRPSLMTLMTSLNSTFNKNMQSFKTRLKNRGYPNEFLEKHLFKVNFKDRKRSLENKQKHKKENIAFYNTIPPGFT